LTGEFTPVDTMPLFPDTIISNLPTSLVKLSVIKAIIPCLFRMSSKKTGIFKKIQQIYRIWRFEIVPCG
jgi:hypothetical protein